MGVSAQLAIAALAESLEDIGEDGDRLVAIVRPLQHQPQQIASDQPVAPSSTLLKIASLPTATPCSFTPISPPQVQ